MRERSRLAITVLVAAVLLAAGALTVRSLRDVDLRGRASWTASPLVLDSTTRALTIFLPACDVRALALYPAPNARGWVSIDYVRQVFDRKGRPGPGGAGGAHVFLASGQPTTLPIRDTAPYWREALTLQMRVVSAFGPAATELPPLALASRPVTMDAFDDPWLGTFACAFDAGSRRHAWTVIAALVIGLLCTAVLAAAWLARAFGRAHGVRPAAPPRVGALVWLAVLLTAATTLVYGLIVPPFEPPDELAHLQYARYIATTGGLPRELPPDDSEWRASSYEWVQQPLYYLGAAVVLRSTGLATPGPALTLNPRSRLQPGGTEPTIFQHAAPPTPATGHRALLLLRGLSALMALATTWVIAHAVVRLTGDGLVAATVAGGLGLVPQWCAVMGAVSTDPPATLLAALATLIVIRLATAPPRPHLLGAAGLAIGAAYAVKATAVFLLPMAGLAVLSSVWIGARASVAQGTRRTVVLPAMRAGLIVAAGFLVAAGWIALRAWNVFGDPSAYEFKRAVLEAGGFVPVRGPLPWQPEFWAQMRTMVFEPFWARFGSLGAGPFPGSRVWVVYAAASGLLAACAVTGTATAVGRAWRRLDAASEGDRHALVVGVCVLGVAFGLTAWVGVNLFPRADMVVHWTPRHILPLTAPAAVVVAAGLSHLASRPSIVGRLTGLATGVTLIALALAGLGVLRATMLMFHFGY